MALPSRLSPNKDEKYAKVNRTTQRKRIRNVLIFASLLVTASFGILGLRRRHNLNGDASGSSNLRKMEQESPSESMTNVDKKPADAVDAVVSESKQNEPTEEQLVQQVEEMDAKVRARKQVAGVFMEVDPDGLKLTEELQRRTRQLLYKRYGNHKGFRVQLDLTFPQSVPDYSEKGSYGKLVFELAPIDLIPCSVFMFLEIARTFQSAAFHRNSGHVLQAKVKSDVKESMPFQEYSPEYPHIQYTMGYAGRPSGPEFYVSTIDNTDNHGPGTQQKENPHEADSLFGKVVEGELDIVPRIHSVPKDGFLDPEYHVIIDHMTILVPSPINENIWVPWDTSRE